MQPRQTPSITSLPTQMAHGRSHHGAPFINSFFGPIIDRVKDSITQCLSIVRARQELHEQLSASELEARENAAEAAVLRTRAEVALLDAEVLRKSLKRAQSLAASQLYDVRQKALMQICFRAIKADGATQVAAAVKAAQPSPAWPFGPAAASANRRNRPLSAKNPFASGRTPLPHALALPPPSPQQQ